MTSIQDITKKFAIMSLLMAFALTMFISTPAGAQDTVLAPITIETEIDVSTDPVTGTFDVVTGADVLGCDSGTLVDTFVPDEGVTKLMTCDSGSNAGTFSILLNLEEGDESGQDGIWSIIPQTAGDFAGLEGEGEMRVVFPDGPIGMETFEGAVGYPAVELAVTGSSSQTLSLIGVSALLLGLAVMSASRRLRLVSN
jgi:hypothetical protein